MRRLIALLICLAILAFVYSVNSQAPSNSITDSAYWRMIQDYSEPDGQFVYENFVSNEVYYQTVIPKLVETVRPGGVYVLALKPSVAFIVDIRRQNLLSRK